MPLESYGVEVAAGCYGIRVVREAGNELILHQELGIFVDRGEVHAFGFDH